MTINFFKHASINTFKSFGNTLLNGFASDISKKDKVHQVGLQFVHFNPINTWALEKYEIVDKSTGDKYCNDSTKTVRLKCVALFAASWIVQPVGLTLNLLNRIAKVATFAHLWYPSQKKYKFKARINEWEKDVLLVVTTPLILVGILFSALYGAILSPYDGRKLYGTFERLAYSGGYQFFGVGYGGKNLHSSLLAPCFQPDIKAHLGGAKLNQKDVW
jgi:hypothetical protein